MTARATAVRCACPRKLQKYACPKYDQFQAFLKCYQAFHPFLLMEHYLMLKVVRYFHRLLVYLVG